MTTVRERIADFAKGKGPVSNRELTDALGVQSETVRRTLHRMVDSGDMLAAGDGRYVLPSSHDDSPQPSTSHSEQDSRDSESVPPDSERTPLYDGVGIGVYSAQANDGRGGMVPWVPKAGQ
jgi:hypothetical protein